MPRTLNATLEAALDTQQFPYPIIRAWFGTDGGKTAQAEVHSYHLDLDTLNAKVSADISGLGYDTIILERGLKIAGVEYTVDSCAFTISDFHRTNKIFNLSARLFNGNAFTVGGGAPYWSIIDQWLLQASGGGMEAEYLDPSADWKDYDFLPTGSVGVDHNYLFPSILQIKYLIFVADKWNVGGADIPIVFSIVDSLARSVDHVLPIKETDIYDEAVFVKKTIWIDELGSFHESPGSNLPVHNLGFLQSTADPPTAHDGDALFQYYPGSKITIPFHLKYVHGDCVEFNSRKSPIRVAEIFDPKHSMPWRLEITPINYTTNTGAGPMPQGIAQIANYTRVNTSPFTGILSQVDTHLQAALETLDGHTHPGGGGYTQEEIEDFVGGMVTGNVETGVTATYDDGTGKIDLAITDEYIQDLVGAMFTGNTETNITVTYQDADGTIDLEVTGSGGASIIETQVFS
jgi:hypothetical protein